MRAAVLFVALVLAAAAGCDPCAGTPSCHMQPEVSYTGQFIERQSGKVVPGVRVEFVRRGGIELSSDTARGVSDSDGFFELRVGTFSIGEVVGELRVTPPAPFQPYTVEAVRLASTRNRGDGGVLGRLVVNPYLQLLGEMHDLKTGAIMAGTTVIVRTTNNPPLIEPPTAQFVTGGDGRYLWEPRVLQYGTIKAQLEIIAPGSTQSLFVDRDITIQHLDGPPYFLFLHVGRALRHVGLTARRGTGEYFGGVTAQFVRTSGIAIQPDSLVVDVGSDGLFRFVAEPLASGDVIGTLTIRPPAPFPAEVQPGITLKTFDDGSFRYMGYFGYGAAAVIRALFKHRATGLPVDSGVLVRVLPAGGLPVVAGPVADSLLRALDSVGGLSHASATADTGQVIFDFEVRLPKPAKWDTVRAQIPARFSDSPASVLTFLIGPP